MVKMAPFPWPDIDVEEVYRLPYARTDPDQPVRAQPKAKLPDIDGLAFYRQMALLYDKSSFKLDSAMDIPDDQIGPLKVIEGAEADALINRPPAGKHRHPIDKGKMINAGAKLAGVDPELFEKILKMESDRPPFHISYSAMKAKREKELRPQVVDYLLGDLVKHHADEVFLFGVTDEQKNKGYLVTYGKRRSVHNDYTYQVLENNGHLLREISLDNPKNFGPEAMRLMPAQSFLEYTTHPATMIEKHHVHLQKQNPVKFWMAYLEAIKVKPLKIFYPELKNTAELSLFGYSHGPSPRKQMFRSWLDKQTIKPDNPNPIKDEREIKNDPEI